MKNRFEQADIVAVTNELQNLIGMRVYQVYDIDTKSYLLKLNRYEEKVTLLLESGIRIHTTDYEWPKNPAPSGFSMKLRKHIKNKRLEKITQLGVDRILDLQFGINEAAYHLILELYDRGNLVLADHEYTILNILRPRTENEDVKFLVRERYPVENAVQKEDEQSMLLRIENSLNTDQSGNSLRKILLTATAYGPALIDHILLLHNIPKNASVGKGFSIATDMNTLLEGLKTANKIIAELSHGPCSGYITQKEEKITLESEKKLYTSTGFYPFLFHQYISVPNISFSSFNKAVDTYFSEMEAQKIECKTHQKEKEALKKLENVKKDHEKRLKKLLEDQFEDIVKAELIETNLDIVEKAIEIIRSAVASQMCWSDIWDLIQEAQDEGDPIAKVIKKLKLETNHFTILLSNPFENDTKPILVDIDLDLSAYGNARKYYDKKRQHAKKEQKTVEASEKAFKNAEKKTKQVLKEVVVISTITKAKKPMWFEKFNWFISSENYLVIAGKDIPQNEVIVKRYMKPNDIYVHADIHGASSVVIKNHLKKEVPLKTLNEAGTFAVCYSTAWNAKVVTNAWWVHAHQVSKTAPTGEYLTTGSFMIRGKKNFLLQSQLILGFGFLFKLGEDSLERHMHERKVKENDLDVISQVDEEENIPIEDDGSSSDEDSKPIKNEEAVAENKPEAKEQINDEKIVDYPDTEVQLPSDQESEGQEASDEEIGEVAFPDTEVQLPIYNKSVEDPAPASGSEVIESKGTKIIISSNKKKSCSITSNKVEGTHSSKDEKAKPGQLKRGQRSKLKKIKEKYKDQDEEERKLRMMILGSAGSTKPDKKKKKDKGGKNASSKQQQKQKPPVPQSILHLVSVEEDNSTEQIIAVNDRESAEEDEDLEETAVHEDTNLLNSLTGQPLAEDTLLYAIPVCAPYNSLQNYKYKVKVMPGTGRRGKAAKTALNIFLHDKHATQREKDCLRSVKDQDISRNFPGKVKLSHSHAKNK